MFVLGTIYQLSTILAFIVNLTSRLPLFGIFQMKSEAGLVNELAVACRTLFLILFYISMNISTKTTGVVA